MATVMIVDDSRVQRKTMRILLEKFGYTVCAEAGNGKEAVELYREFEPDIVTMDITMPVMTGVEASKIIMEEYPSAQIIIITSLDQERSLEIANEYGVKSYIIKPITEEALKQALDSL